MTLGFPQGLTLSNRCLLWATLSMDMYVALDHMPLIPGPLLALPCALGATVLEATAKDALHDPEHPCSIPPASAPAPPTCSEETKQQPEPAFHLACSTCSGLTSDTLAAQPPARSSILEEMMLGLG